MLESLRLDGKRVFFVFPVFNESPNLDRVFSDTETLGAWVTRAGGVPRFLFVDDGSTDDTASRIEVKGTERFELLKHPRNEGPGRAFQTAFARLLGGDLGDEDVVVTLEADATSDPAVFGRMMAHLALGDDVVLASPYLYGGALTEVHWHRLLISHLANGLVKLFLGIRGLTTFSCFYRAHKGSALRALEQRYGRDTLVRSKGFECAVELLVKMTRCRLAISEVPFRVDWSRRKGKSKMRVLRTVRGYIRLFLTL